MRGTMAVMVVVLAAAPAGASGVRILERELPAEAVERVAVDVGVGDVAVTGGAGRTVRVRVELVPRRGGFPFLGSARKGREQVRAAELRAERVGSVLSLEVRGPWHRRRFEERWVLELPAGVQLVLDTGVGDVTVHGLSGGVRLDVGVGDVRLELEGGDVEADVGVGDLRIRFPLEAAGDVDVTTGVGDATLRLPDRELPGRGTVGAYLRWTGTGRGRIAGDVGVGDVEVTLVRRR